MAADNQPYINYQMVQNGLSFIEVILICDKKFLKQKQMASFTCIFGALSYNIYINDCVLLVFLSMDNWTPVILHLNLVLVFDELLSN